MIDYFSIEKYRENNRIEAKRALGGLPKSIWETYSAFANTLGGIILLGVEEHNDKSLHPVDLPDPQALIDEFTSLLNNKNRVSVNILTKNNIKIQSIDGKKIIVITVPRAQRWEMPVYIEKDPLYSTYRRSGEGDYRLTPQAVKKLLADSKKRTADMQVIDYTLADLNEASVEKFITLCLNNSRNDPLKEMKITEEDKLTKAGLLILGKYSSIKKVFPNYKISINGKEITENLLNFYLTACKYFEHLNFESDVIDCFKEATVNAITNNDYSVQGEIKININSKHIEFINSGGFNIDIKEAKEGGISDPRNPLITKIFSFIFNTNRLGSGIPHIFKIWQKNNWSAPVYIEKNNQVFLMLCLYNDDIIKGTIPPHFYKETIIEYLTEHIFASVNDIALLLDISKKDAQNLISLMPDLIVQAKESPTLYKLKER